MVRDHGRADVLGLLLHLLHQPGALDDIGEAGIVLDVGGDHQLAARLVARDEHRLEHGARGVDGGGVAGGAGAEDDELGVQARHIDTWSFGRARRHAQFLRSRPCCKFSGRIAAQMRRQGPTRSEPEWNLRPGMHSFQGAPERNAQLRSQKVHSGRPGPSRPGPYRAFEVEHQNWFARGARLADHVHRIGRHDDGVRSREHGDIWVASGPIPPPAPAFRDDFAQAARQGAAGERREAVAMSVRPRRRGSPPGRRSARCRLM